MIGNFCFHTNLHFLHFSTLCIYRVASNIHAILVCVLLYMIFAYEENIYKNPAWLVRFLSSASLSYIHLSPPEYLLTENWICGLSFTSMNNNTKVQFHQCVMFDIVNIILCMTCGFTVSSILADIIQGILLFTVFNFWHNIIFSCIFYVSVIVTNYVTCIGVTLHV